MIGDCRATPTIPDDTQRLLQLCSRVTSDGAWGTTCSTKDPTEVACMQGKHITQCTVSPTEAS